MQMKEDLSNIAESHLGMSGRMISFSKSGYIQRHPKHIVIFNSNICTEGGKIWQGDIDVTLAKDALLDLAREIDRKVYVLYEMDGRFENEDSPKLNRAVATFFPDGTYLLNKDLQSTLTL